MIKFIILPVIAFFNLLCPVLGQDHSYAHYDVKDGLAGSTVYSMVQDRDGFMWFGTETGLSRFDGTHFKNFTTADGLPDNEILNTFVDSRNRVWLMPFKNSIAYYWKGKIHNQQNDSVLKRLKITGEVRGVLENKEGDILISEALSVHIIDRQGKITTISEIGGKIYYIGQAFLDSAGEFKFILVIHWKPCLAKIEKDSMKVIQYDFVFWRNGVVYVSGNLNIIYVGDSLSFRFPDKNADYRIHVPTGLVNISRINDSSVTLNTSNGAYLVNIRQKKITDSFWKGQIINAVKEDSEGNTWFSVMGKGISRLGSAGFVNYTFPLQNNPLPVFCIQRIDSAIYVGTDHFLIWMIGRHGDIRKRSLREGRSRGRVMALVKVGGKDIVIGRDDGLYAMRDWKERAYYPELPIKSIFVEDDSSLLVCSGLFTTEVRSDNLLAFDTVLYFRSTCGYKKDSLYYIGTLDGLYIVDRHKKIFYPGDHYKILKSRITEIKESSDGVLWIATDGEGLVGYKEGRIIANIREGDGLTSNICRTIFIAGKDLWVGTDKGLNKIAITGAGYHITSFTNLDGLNSDIINAVYVEGSRVYAGTAEGITFFDAGKIARRSECRLEVTGITIAEREWAFDTTNFVIPHKENDIQFDFVGISYRSAGNITYQYMLKGLDDKWKTTTRTSLNYPTLPSGAYELQLQAINKFGVRSGMVAIDFVVDKLLWEKLWFRIVGLMALVGLVWLAFALRVKMIRRKEEEKSATIARMAELEQMALRSQMNPHFIFNCLNSIQQFVMDRDVRGVNEFITNFSRLIRQTLELSSRSRISLQEEILYISTYLELEKRRFEDKFVYEIVISKEINGQDYHIPPMILQPYVENAIRHGIGLRKDNKGRIRVKMALNGENLVCIIEDNGVGRKLAGQFRGRNPIEYQSRGMALTEKRIEMFNRTNKSPVLITIEDLEDQRQAPAGTRITLCFSIGDIKG